jgi:GAF domain-containing protein
VVVAGEALGLVLLLFDEREEISTDVQRLLTAISAAMGFALLRDRLADELRETAGQG